MTTRITKVRAGNRRGRRTSAWAATLMLLGAIAVGGPAPVIASTGDEPEPETVTESVEAEVDEEGAEPEEVAEPAVAAATADAEPAPESESAAHGERLEGEEEPQEEPEALVAAAAAPWATVTPQEISQWDLAEQGIVIFAEGFEPDAVVTVSTGATVLGETSANHFGELEISFTAEADPGQHIFRLASGEAAVEVTLSVLADEDFFEDEADAYLLSAPRVIKISELEEEAIELSAFNFPSNSAVEVRVNGDRETTAISNGVGSIDFTFSAPREVGRYVIELVHPAVTLSHTIDVVPDEPQEQIPAGVYVGTSLQTRTASSPIDPVERPFSAVIDDDGKLAGLVGEFSYACIDPVTGELIGRDILDLADSDFVPQRISAGIPFEFGWEGEYYRIHGTIDENGNGEGELRHNLGACGTTLLKWQLGDGVIDPTEPGEPTEPTEPGEPTEPTDPADPSETGEEFPAPKNELLDPGSKGGITAPSHVTEGSTIDVGIKGAGENQRVGMWLFSDPISLGIKSTSADGTVSVTLPTGVTGEHRLVAVDESGAVIGWQNITIAPAQEPQPGSDSGTTAGDRESSIEQLPSTGASMALAGVAVLALLTGGALTAITRRRLATR